MYSTLHDNNAPLSVLSINTSDVDERLPTPETMKQLFNGVPFEELPIVYIKATKNNTLIHCIDHKATVYLGVIWGWMSDAEDFSVPTYHVHLVSAGGI